MIAAFPARLKKIIFVPSKKEEHVDNASTYYIDDSMIKRDNMKNLVKKLVIIYHPDKQGAEDRKWFLTSRQITMNLNNIYECYKT